MYEGHDLIPRPNLRSLPIMPPAKGISIMDLGPRLEAILECLRIASTQVLVGLIT